MATEKTTKAAAKAATKAASGKKFNFNFEAKDKSIKFDLPELASEPFSVEKVTKGKKDPEREFVTLKIKDHLFMLDGGILNEASGFDKVTDETDRNNGLLSLLDGARISHSGGVVTFQYVA